MTCRVEVDPDVALHRGVTRDAPREGLEAATRVHRDRYGVAARIYLGEVSPRALADVAIDNTDLARPRIMTAGRG